MFVASMSLTHEHTHPTPTSPTTTTLLHAMLPWNYTPATSTPTTPTHNTTNEGDDVHDDDVHDDDAHRRHRNQQQQRCAQRVFYTWRQIVHERTHHARVFLGLAHRQHGGGDGVEGVGHDGVVSLQYACAGAHVAVELRQGGLLLLLCCFCCYMLA